jgi:transcriptional regulator of acetoin/glycerol metabolism
MCSTPRIGVRDLPAGVRQPAYSLDAETHEPKELNLHQTERNLIFRALEESGGNRTEAASILGISRRTLHRRLKELNITKHTLS